MPHRLARKVEFLPTVVDSLEGAMLPSIPIPLSDCILISPQMCRSTWKQKFIFCTQARGQGCPPIYQLTITIFTACLLLLYIKLQTAQLPNFTLLLTIKELLL
ncbi:UNVERIFIED_CONTAM: hypothetical protein K2H54_055641 [Gekko kuhli]